MKTKLIVILGPTASGKSNLAVQIAKKIGGEVISADSRQVYKGLNIGTGKITSVEMQGIPHHLLDVADPKETFTVADYVKLAEKAIADITKRNKIPIICGGTGFYIQALVDGLSIPEVPPNEELRKGLSTKTISELNKILERLDPARFETIDKDNPRRLIRAIEIATALGSVPLLEKTYKYDTRFIGIDMPMDILKERIHKRLLSRIKNGMIEEIRNLHDNGLSWERMEDLGLEYRYVSRHLQGMITEKEMLEQLEMEICHYAKRQMTWFKRDKKIEWYKSGEEALLAFK
ncbi:MAG: tRNA (adenosine(37)-N6)-dimethylallyltransferase MiaA [Candidatus Paceibacterota bacterium]|jgi:tRNA dimethylallyltransferase